MISNWFKFLTLAILILTFSAQRCATMETRQGYSKDSDVHDDQSFSGKTTILTFYIEQKVEQKEDKIEMSLTIKEKDNSLKKAIDKASKKAALVKAQCEDYCKRNKGKNCDEMVQIDNFKAEPSYQILRRQPIFNGFIVTNVAKIQVNETEGIGQLVDSLLGLGIYQMDELEWKPHQEIDSVEKAIDSGISQAQKLCGHIDRKIGAVLSITEIFEEDDNEEKKDDQQTSDEDDDDEEEPAILKFQVECREKTPEEIQAEIAEAAEAAKKSKKTKGRK